MTQPLFSCFFKNFSFNTNKKSQESGSPLGLMSNEAEGECDRDCKVFSLHLAILLHTLEIHGFHLPFLFHRRVSESHGFMFWF